MKTERRCDQCEWWVLGGDHNIYLSENNANNAECPEDLWGECRFSPPIHFKIKDDGGKMEQNFPHTMAVDWCRQFALREDLAIEKQKERERQRIGTRAPTRVVGEW